MIETILTILVLWCLLGLVLRWVVGICDYIDDYRQERRDARLMHSQGWRRNASGEWESMRPDREPTVSRPYRMWGGSYE